VGHGFEFSGALLDIAPDYPKQKYFVTSFLPQPKIPSNLLFINLGYFGAAYGAGALAALISEKKQAVGSKRSGEICSSSSLNRRRGSQPHYPLSSRPERTRISYFALLATSTCAALRRESRIQILNATGLHRKSGGAQWRDLR
jgi:hypothetical protein